MWNTVHVLESYKYQHLQATMHMALPPAVQRENFSQHHNPEPNWERHFSSNCTFFPASTGLPFTDVIPASPPTGRCPQTGSGQHYWRWPVRRQPLPVPAAGTVSRGTNRRFNAIVSQLWFWPFWVIYTRRLHIWCQFFW